MEFEKFPFFTSFSEYEHAKLREELRLYKRTYKKDECLFTQGDVLHELYFLSIGRLAIYHENIDGELGLISYIEEGACFAESYAMLHLPLSVTIIALQDSEILYFSIPTTIPLSQSIQKVILTWNQMLAQKNIMMNERMQILTYKKMRSRLCAYFHELSIKQNSTTIHLPFHRQAMADYLCIDRSALSRELSNMVKEHLIFVDKQRIHLLYLANT